MAETAHLIETRHGARVEAEFIRRISRMEIECPEPEDWTAIADLVERYGDFPLGTTDASVAVLAERLDTDLIITLDRRHFSAIRMPSGRTFTILPN
jgi:predicted nucleic acid-binding protein